MIFPSTTTEHSFPSRNRFQQQQQQQQQQNNINHQELRKPALARSKRRFSDDEEVLKKNKPSTPSREQQQQQQQQQDYPKFHHPDGGFIQFTPNGTIRTIIKDNTEISEFQSQSENKFNFKNINHGIDGYKLNSFSPTPSVESYMANGYNNAANTTTTSDFYSYDCDSDLDYEDDDCQMS